MDKREIFNRCGWAGRKKKESLFVCILFSLCSNFKMCIWLFFFCLFVSCSFICVYLWFLHLSPAPTHCPQAIQVIHLLPTHSCKDTYTHTHTHTHSVGVENDSITVSLRTMPRDVGRGQRGLKKRER